LKKIEKNEIFLFEWNDEQQNFDEQRETMHFYFEQYIFWIKTENDILDYQILWKFLKNLKNEFMKIEKNYEQFYEEKHEIEMQVKNDEHFELGQI
jgi:hypothetical protein